MSIKAKLSWAFGVIIAILVLEIALNQVVSYRATRTYEKLTSEIEPVLSMLNKFQSVNKELGLLITGKVSGGLSERNQNRMKGILEVEIPYYKTEVYLLQEGLAPEDPKVRLCADAVLRANTISGLCQTINRLLVTTEDHENQTKKAQVNHIIDHQLADELFQLHNNIEALRLQSKAEYDQFQLELSEDLRLVSWIILITGLFGVLFGLGLAVITTRNILKPIEELNTSALRVAEGHYKTRVPLKRADELTNLSRSFNTMADSLETSFNQIQNQNKELEQFTFIASHDLQEPVRTITSFSELLTDMYSNKLDETGKQSLQFINEAATRMRALIKGLLDYSRLGQSRVRSQIDCIKLIDEVKTDLTTSIEEKNARILVHSLPVISGYEMEVRLLFQNLISNAIKFTNKTPQIEISATRLQNAWQFSVKDNGIGIAKAHQEKIFTIFQRLNAKDAYAGTGIGLAHCMKIVQLHGGEIWVNSEEGKESTFSFTILDIDQQNHD